MKNIIKIISFIILITSLNFINFEKKYLIVDINNYIDSLKRYNLDLSISFLIVALIIIIIIQKLQQSTLNLKAILLKNSWWILLFSLSLFLTGNKFFGKYALGLNKVKTIGKIERKFEINFIEKEEKYISIFSSKQTTDKIFFDNYNEIKNLEAGNYVNITSKIGLLNIPFDSKIENK